QRTVQGATREYLVVEYAPARRGQPGDRLYVPTDQLDQVTRYVGGEAPALHRLGGAEWGKAKGRARKAGRQIAGELIRLYCARQVPTSLVVQQPHSTFSERLANFPIVVQAVSRFNSGKEQEEALAGLAAGRVDVVIGTQRLLSADTRFKDLGLVIVDEEQRFG